MAQIKKQCASKSEALAVVSKYSCPLEGRFQEEKQTGKRLR